jgi:hypothetical protein
MIIKIDNTEIKVPDFITEALNKKKNKRLFDDFIQNLLTAQAQRIRKSVQETRNGFNEFLKMFGK